MVMRDLNELSLPHSELPEYDYDKYVAMSAPDSNTRRLPYRSEAFDRSPEGIKVDRPVAELLRI